MSDNKETINGTKINLAKVLLTISIFLLIISSIVVGFKQGMIEPFLNRPQQADIFTYNNILDAKFMLGNIHVNGVHSFLIKWPIFILQNLIGTNKAGYIISSILCLLIMNLGIAYIIYRFSKKNPLITSLVIFFLACITLTTDPSYPYLSMSWLTMRNIEIPIYIIVISIALNLNFKKPISIKNLVIIFLMSSLFLSDKLLLYFSVAGLCIFMFIQLIINKKRWLQDNMNFVLVVGLASVLTVITEYSLKLLRIVSFDYIYQPPQKLIKSFNELIELFSDSVHSTLMVFGANISKVFIEGKAIYILCLLVIAMSIFASIHIIYGSIKNKNCNRTSDVPIFNKNTIIYLISFVSASYIFYWFIDRNLNEQARFLIFSMPVGLMAIAYNFRNFNRTLNIQKFFVIIVLLFCTFSGTLHFSNKLYSQYTSNFNSLEKPYDEITSILRDKGIHVLVGSAYIHNVRFVYKSTSLNEELSLNVIRDCNQVRSGLFLNNWYKPTNRKIAIYNKLFGCNFDKMVELYGAPSEIYNINSNSENDKLYIYDYDIRSKFQYDKRIVQF